jgi:hypothetical protein
MILVSVGVHRRLTMHRQRPHRLWAGFDAYEAAAIWMTLAACCGLHQVDFEAYLTDVLPRMVDHDPDRIEELLPHNWKPLTLD